MTESLANFSKNMLKSELTDDVNYGAKWDYTVAEKQVTESPSYNHATLRHRHRKGMMGQVSSYGAATSAVHKLATTSRGVFETGSSAPSQSSSLDAPERCSITPLKTFVKDYLLRDTSRKGFRSLRSPKISVESPCDGEQDEHACTDWALYSMEHAWMLAVVDGNYETILEFISEDANLITRKDFVSGFTVLHWLAKRGQDETLIKLLHQVENGGISVDVNLKGSGGLTPLHVAAIHSQYMVIKILVGAFGANIDAMDYNGKRAWQYLKGNVPLEIKELLGAWDDEHLAAQNLNNNCACANNLHISEIEAEENEVLSVNRAHSDVSGRFGSFRRLFSQVFGNRS